MISLAGLVLTIVPSVLVFLHEMPLQEHKNLMFVGTLLWFFSAPFWMKEQKL